MGSIVDKSGAEVVYHVVQSINRPEWPANAVKGMKREETATCYLYRQDLHGLVRCFLWGEIYDLSPLSQRVAEYVIAGIWLNMTRSVKCAQAKRLSALIATNKPPPITASSSECSVCSRHVSIFGSSHVECAGCGEVRTAFDVGYSYVSGVRKLIHCPLSLSCAVFSPTTAGRLQELLNRPPGLQCERALEEGRTPALLQAVLERRVRVPAVSLAHGRQARSVGLGSS